jgi:2,3-diketo-5-methylthio-1-phosphopentane phosphatase
MRVLLHHGPAFVHDYNVYSLPVPRMLRCYGTVQMSRGRYTAGMVLRWQVGVAGTNTKQPAPERFDNPFCGMRDAFYPVGMKYALVSDFDGTITRNDFYLLIARQYMDGTDLDRYFSLYREGKMSHFDAMAAYFSHAPTDAAELDRLIEETEPDAGLADAVRKLRDASWELIIVSAGSSWYIDRILRRVGVDAAVHSNPGSIEAGRGLVLEKPINSPFFCEEVGVNKAAVVQDAIGRYQKVAFAGDGPPDVEPALLVPPDMRFARSYLAEELRRRGEAFHSFSRWSEVAPALL